MASQPPEGEPVPLSGRLPEGMAEARQEEPLSLYLHIPWCRRRCGYCDFNTYVLGDDRGSNGFSRQLPTAWESPSPAAEPSPTAEPSPAAEPGRGLVARCVGTAEPPSPAPESPSPAAEPGRAIQGEQLTPARPGEHKAYLAALEREIELAARILGPRRVTTIYFGGGTPTLLDTAGFARLLGHIGTHFDIATDAEITTEANPETLSPAYLARLRLTGVNRLSLGMQSAVPHVLRALDRVHTPGRAVEAVSWARQAGFGSVSLDLIYGTPGESMADWQTSLEVALGANPDHLSAYSLITEPGTPLARRIARGELPPVDEDDLADKYLAADAALTAAGLNWYEVSNWAKPGHQCRHNLAYWHSTDWWGLGAGAHSYVGSSEPGPARGCEHPLAEGPVPGRRAGAAAEASSAEAIAGIRWWNHRLPRDYGAQLQAGHSPAEARELLTAAQHRTERILLELRLSTGLDPALLTATEQSRLPTFLARGLLTRSSPTTCLVLTQAGRLVSDGIIRDLLD